MAVIPLCQGASQSWWRGQSYTSAQKKPSAFSHPPLCEMGSSMLRGLLPSLSGHVIINRGGTEGTIKWPWPPRRRATLGLGREHSERGSERGREGDREGGTRSRSRGSLAHPCRPSLPLMCKATPRNAGSTNEDYNRLQYSEVRSM